MARQTSAASWNGDETRIVNRLPFNPLRNPEQMKRI